MKKILSGLLLVALLCGLLSGCGQKTPETTTAAATTAILKEVTLDDSLVIVAGEAEQEAALCLQTVLSHRLGVTPEITDRAPEGGKTLTLQVDGSLAKDQYRTRIVNDGLVIDAHSALVLTMAVRDMRSVFLADGGLTVTEAMCEALSGTADLANAPFLVMSQNIRYADDEGGNMVAQRAPRFRKQVWEYLPDLLCIQEDNQLWSGILDKYFASGYGIAGMFSGGPDSTTGNRQAIIFRTDRFSLQDSGCVWLSDTPDTPMTKLEDSKSVRTCTWALLEDSLTGKTLLVCNVHLDTRSDEVRSAQLEVLYAQLGEKMEAHPTLLCGDFNSRPESPVYGKITEQFSDPHVTATTKLSDLDVTYTGYGQAEEFMRLDYLFYSKDITAGLYSVLDQQYDGYISDHYGILARFRFAQ